MLSEALDFLLLLQEYKGSVTKAVFVVAIIVSIRILTASYRKRWIQYLLNKRNRIWVVLWLLSGAGLITFVESKQLEGSYLYLFFWLLYTMGMIDSMKPRVDRHQKQVYTNKILKHYNSYLEQGAVYEHIGFFTDNGTLDSKVGFLFRHCPWMIDADILLEYKFLCVAYYERMGELREAKQILDSIKKELLYEEEQQYLKLLYAQLLIQMGNVLAGERNLSELPDMPEKFLLLAMVEEARGNINQAFQYAKDAKSMVEADSGYRYLAASLYHNYARFALLYGQKHDAEECARIAWRHARESSDAYIKNILGASRIQRAVQTGKTLEQCLEILKDYEKSIDVRYIENLKQYANTHIMLYRRFDEKKAYELIKRYFFELQDRIGLLKDLDEKNILRIVEITNTLQMLLNGKYVYDWIDSYLYSYEQLNKLPLLRKLNMMQILTEFYSQLEFRVVYQKEPYKTLLEQIYVYYRTSALQDIEEERDRLDPSYVYFNRALSEQWLYIVKVTAGTQFSESIKQEYLQLADSLKEAGLEIESTYVLLHMLNHAADKNNISIQIEGMEKAMFYQQFIDNDLKQAPEPTTLADGVYLNYYQFQFIKPVKIIPVQIAFIQEYIEKVMNAVRTWKNHPAKADISIYLVRFLLAMERDDEAKEFLGYIDASDNKSGDYVAWAQELISSYRIALREKEDF